MWSRCLHAAVLMALLAIPALPNEAKGDQRLERLFGSFLAPCCWQESLLVHRSPAADELRTRIRGYVQAGWTDERIQQQLIREHSRRLLAVPDGPQGQALFWMPVVAVLAGVALVGRTLWRAAHSRGVQAPPDAHLPEIDMESVA